MSRFRDKAIGTAAELAKRMTYGDVNFLARKLGDEVARTHDAKELVQQADKPRGKRIEKKDNIPDSSCGSSTHAR